MRKKLIKLDRKKLVTMMTLSFMLSAVFVLQIGFPVLAAENDGSTVIQTGWAQSMNSQDGGAQSMAFKRIAGGLVAVITPQLIPVITSSVGA